MSQRPNRFNDPFQNLRDREERLAETRRMLGILGQRTDQILPATQRQYENIVGEELRRTERFFMDQPPIYNTNFYGPNPYAYNENDTIPLSRLKLKPQSQRINPFRERYQFWEKLFRDSTKQFLNTPLKRFRAGSKRSIEPLLLRAIAEKKVLLTKTTEFSPNTFNVNLYGSKIVSIDEDTYCIKQVTLPTAFETKEKLNLFRHRLRQLGLRCKIVSRKTALFLNYKDFVILTPGMTFDIPESYRKPCLPKGVLNQANVLFTPPQLTFEFAINKEGFELPEYGFTTGHYIIKFFCYLLNGDDLQLKVIACPHYRNRKILKMFDRSMSIHRRDWFSYKETYIKHLTKDIRKQLEDEIYARENYNNSFDWLGGATSTTSTINATTAYTMGNVTYRAVYNDTTQRYTAMPTNNNDRYT